VPVHERENVGFRAHELIPFWGISPNLGQRVTLKGALPVKLRRTHR